MPGGWPLYLGISISPSYQHSFSCGQYSEIKLGLEQCNSDTLSAHNWGHRDQTKTFERFGEIGGKLKKWQNGPKRMELDQKTMNIEENYIFSISKPFANLFPVIV